MLLAHYASDNRQSTSFLILSDRNFAISKICFDSELAEASSWPELQLAGSSPLINSLSETPSADKRILPEKSVPTTAVRLTEGLNR